MIARDSQTSRFGFLFLSLTGVSQLPFGLMPIRSYVRSTDDYRKSCGQNSVGGVEISVMVRPPFPAIPFREIERHFTDPMTAVSTAFAAGKPSLDLKPPPTVPLALASQLPHPLSPTYICNRSRETVVFHPVLHSQIFNSISTPTTSLLLQLGVLSTSYPKVNKSFLQVPESLMQRHATYLVEELQLFLLFPACQRCGSFAVAKDLLPFISAFRAAMQRFVVD